MTNIPLFRMMDLPDDQLQPLAAGVKAKLAASGLGGRLDGLKKLF